jgi:hypothetical protein
MVTSRSVPQQMEQMLSARAGHRRFGLRLLQIGHAKVFSLNSGTKIMPHFRSGLTTGSKQCAEGSRQAWELREQAQLGPDRRGRGFLSSRVDGPQTSNVPPVESTDAAKMPDGHFRDGGATFF